MFLYLILASTSSFLFMLFGYRIAAAASFDCGTTSDQISKAVCSDDALSQEDSRMAGLYTAYIDKMTKQYNDFSKTPRTNDARTKSLPEQIRKAKAVQAAWLVMSRGACSQEALPDLHDQVFCLQKVYNSRIGQLEVDNAVCGYDMPSGDQPPKEKHWQAEQNNEPPLCGYVKKFGEVIPDNEHASLVPLDKLHIYNPTYNHDMDTSNINFELHRYELAKEVKPRGSDRIADSPYMAPYDYNNSGRIGLIIENRYQSHMTGASQQDYFLDNLEQLETFRTWNAMQSSAMLDPLKNASTEIRSYIGGGYDHEWGYVPFRYKGQNYFHGVLMDGRGRLDWIFRFLNQTETETECLFHS